MDGRILFDEMKQRIIAHPTLMDDVPFTVAVRRSMALAQLIIRTTLSQEDLVVTDVRCQEKVPGIGHKGVVFDALCFDGCGNMYDVEVQKGRFEDLPKRAAFYEAMLTVHSLEVGGRNYDRMPKRVVIFICDVDVEKRGEAVYDYSRRSADGRMLGDGGRIVFVNGEYRADDAIGHLMADMDQSDPERAFNEEVRESLTMLAGEEGLKEMSDEMERLRDAIFNDGKAEGEKIGETRGEARGESRMQREVAQRMLKIGTYSIEEISRITGLSADQVGEAASGYVAK